MLACALRPLEGWISVDRIGWVLNRRLYEYMNSDRSGLEATKSVC